MIVSLVFKEFSLDSIRMLNTKVLKDTELFLFAELSKN